MACKEGVYNLTEDGNRVPHGCVSDPPQPGTGVTITSDGGQDIVVIPGGTYLLTAVSAVEADFIKGYAGIAFPPALAPADVVHLVSIGRTIVIKIPHNVTLITVFVSEEGLVKAFLRRLADTPHNKIT